MIHRATILSTGDELTTGRIVDTNANWLADKLFEIGIDVVAEGIESAAQRELLHVDDLADACVFLMENYSDSLHINVGTGEDLSILQIAELTRDIVYPECEIVLDPSKPDGMPRKLLDVSRLPELDRTESRAASKAVRKAVEEGVPAYLRPPDR